MPSLDQYYWNNPISIIDRNEWVEQYPQVALNFRDQSVYTPLVQWTSELSTTRSRQGMIVTELLEGETNADELPFTATTTEAIGVDSRARTFTYGHYGGKVQLNRKSNIFNMWKFGAAGNDWTPLLRGILGRDVLQKHEILSRNIHLKGPKDRWTYAGSATNWATINATDYFNLNQVIEWNFRLGNYGSPVIPGDSANAKVAIVPPGVVYSIRKSLRTATGSEAALYRDARLYAGQALNYEIGEYSGVRFVEAPNDRFGINPAVLYNSGAITAQYAVTAPIRMGDGAPDPETTKVDEVFMVGQKNRTHYIQLESGADMSNFALNDIVTIHTERTSAYGVDNGVDPLSGRTIQRRVVGIDAANKRLVFDRPVLFNYEVPMAAKSVTGDTDVTCYAFVTKGRNIGMCLVLGSVGGTLGAVVEPLKFYEPAAIDDFQQIWRFTYDMTLGYNVWDPNLFEVHFCAVPVPKPGGVIG